MLIEAFELRHVRRDANVDGAKIVGDRRAARHRDRFGIFVNLRDDPNHKARACKACKSHQINVELIPCVVSRHKPGQHA